MHPTGIEWSLFTNSNVELTTLYSTTLGEEVLPHAGGLPAFLHGLIYRSRLDTQNLEPPPWLYTEASPVSLWIAFQLWTVDTSSLRLKL